MEYIITVLVLIIILLLYVIWNLLRNSELLEDELEVSQKYIETSYTSMKNAYDKMISIDRLGSFESDDESGYIFKEIKSAIEELNEAYKLDAEEEKE